MTTSPLAKISRRLAVSLCAVAGFASLPPALAQTSAGTYTPQVGQAGKDVIWVPTPDAVVTRMLQMAEVKPTDHVVDLGSGDGKITIAAARSFGAPARGLEYNPDMVALSKRMAEQAGVADRVSFEQADIFVTDFSQSTVVTMYLLPQLNLKLRPQLFAMPPGTRVVSHSFSMGDWMPDETSRVNNASVFLWRIPANASGTWQLTAGPLSGKLDFTQKYQVLTGSASFGELQVSVQQPELSGAGLRFQLREPGGVLARYEGRVDGNRITGLVHRPGQAPTPFQAQREGAAVPLQITLSSDEVRLVARQDVRSAAE